MSDERKLARMVPDSEPLFSSVMLEIADEETREARKEQWRRDVLGGSK